MAAKLRKKLRQSITATGSFVSLPEAFPGADDAVKFAPKIEVQADRFEDSRHPLKIEHVMRPHALLVDLEAVDVDAFDAKKLIQDCDLLRSAAEKNPEDLKNILAAFSTDAHHDKMLDAAQLVSKLGLSEDQITKKGGGLLWLVVVAIAVAASSCKDCAHSRGSMRQ